MTLRRALFCLTVLVLLSPAGAAAGGIELNPSIGYVAGGNFDDRPFKTELDDDFSLGLGLDLPIGPGTQLELWWGRLASEITLGAPAFIGVDTDIDYYQVGVLQYWDRGRAEPFYLFSVGATQVRPRGFATKTVPSAAIGGGTRVFLGRGARLGFRFTGRILASYFQGSGVLCDDVGCLAGFDGNFLLQAQIDAGLTIRFR